MNNDTKTINSQIDRQPFDDLIEEVRTKQQACKRFLRETAYSDDVLIQLARAMKLEELGELTQQLVRIHRLAPKPTSKPKLIIA